MAARKYHIETPDQLLQLAALTKSDHIIERMARVWGNAIRKNGKTRWDNAIFAEFSGDRTRIARIIRDGADGRPVDCANLRYNLALMWCEKHLKEASP